MNRRSFCARLLGLFGFAAVGAKVAVPADPPVLMGMDLATGPDSTSFFFMDKNGLHEFPSLREGWKNVYGAVYAPYKAEFQFVQYGYTAVLEGDRMRVEKFKS